MLPFSNSSVEHPWWVKIDTNLPQCTYFFGPFASSQEAQLHRSGYFDDLFAEGAEGINIVVEQGDPKVLTLEEGEPSVVVFPQGQVSQVSSRPLSLVS